MMRRCERDPAPEQLHQWRGPVKDLYYQSLALHELPGMKGRIENARKLGRLLGKRHDFWLLEQHFRNGEHDGTLKEVRKRARKTCRRAFGAAERLFCSRPAKLQRCLTPADRPAGNR